MLSLTNVDQAANQIPDHVVQKRPSFKIEHDHIAHAPDLGAPDCLDRRLCLAGGSTERREIVFTEQQRRTALHGVHIERVMIPTGPTMPDARTLRSIDQYVAITTAEGRETRMKFGADRMHPAHGNGVGEKGIDAAYPGGEWPAYRRIEMNDLPGRMHARICSPSTNDFDRHASNLLQRRFERVLDGVSTGLCLPAAKSAPVILNTQSKPHRLHLNQKEIAAINHGNQHHRHDRVVNQTETLRAYFKMLSCA